MPPTWRFRIVARLAILLVRLLRWQVITEGLEHVPRTGGAVVTWNHTGHIDFVMCAWDIYRRLGRQVRFLAKRELWASRWTRGIVRWVGAVPVDRRSGPGRARSFADAVEALRAGQLVGVAPEGTISMSFELLPFRAGAARMAQEAGVPIIPSVSWASHRLATTGRRFAPRRAYRIPVVIRYGAPIHIGPDDEVNDVTARLRETSQQLLHEVQANYPDGTPPGAWWVPVRLGGGAPPPKRADREPPVAEPGPISEPPFERLEATDDGPEPASEAG